MKSIRTEARIHGARGDERIRTAVPGGTNETLYVEDGERVYPCRCGVTHTGPYAAYDYAHHNCFHAQPLLVLPDCDPICPDCGKTFPLARAAVARAGTGNT